ncbi:MAG: VPLPA-CTERM sorting domain-containing protein [Methylococcales bacterium]|nr:VPLPA-CTERM sorting domain-containing protein [Methylococcales bacterium]
MKKLNFYSVTATLLIAFSSMASAAHIANPEYDFGHDAVGNEHGATSILLNAKRGHEDNYGHPGLHSGINQVTATGYKDQGLGKTTYGVGDQAYYAYLDDFSSKKEAGLGVCKQLGTVKGRANQCVPGNDDNVTKGEVLKLSFKEKEAIHKIEFHDANHNWDFTGNVDISVDGGDYVTYALTHFLDLNLLGKDFLFRNGNAGETFGEQFYITAINTTPIPAAVWLFVSGLGSLGYFRKKKPNLKLVA